MGGYAATSPFQIRINHKDKENVWDVQKRGPAAPLDRKKKRAGGTATFRAASEMNEVTTTPCKASKAVNNQLRQLLIRQSGGEESKLGYV